MFCLVLTSFVYNPKGVATISLNNCITLDDNEAVFDSYLIDISHFNFPTLTEAEKNFGYISSNLLSFKVDFANKKAEMFLLKKNLLQKNWGKPEWVSYLQSRCKN